MADFCEFLYERLNIVLSGEIVFQSTLYEVWKGYSGFLYIYLCWWIRVVCIVWWGTYMVFSSSAYTQVLYISFISLWHHLLFLFCLHYLASLLDSILPYVLRNIWVFSSATVQYTVGVRRYWSIRSAILVLRVALFSCVCACVHPSNCTNDTPSSAADYFLWVPAFSNLLLLESEGFLPLMLFPVIFAAQNTHNLYRNKSQYLVWCMIAWVWSSKKI